MTKPKDAGVNVYSTPSHWKPFMVFCVGNTPEKDEAFQKYAAAVGLPHKVVQGQFKGKRETSYVVPLTGLNIFQCWDWFEGESSVLLLSRPERSRRGWRKAALWHLRKDGPEAFEEIGTFKSVPESEAMGHDSWTFDPITQAYFICDKEGEQARVGIMEQLEITEVAA